MAGPGATLAGADQEAVLTHTVINWAVSFVYPNPVELSVTHPFYICDYSSNSPLTIVGMNKDIEYRGV